MPMVRTVPFILALLQISSTINNFHCYNLFYVGCRVILSKTVLFSELVLDIPVPALT